MISNGNRKRKRSKISVRRYKNTRGYKVDPMRVYSSFERPSLTWFEPHKYVTLRYSDNYTTGTLAATTGIQQLWNLNSLFDPDRTGTGHQPMGFDTLATIYNRYRVLKVKYKMCFPPTTNVYSVVVVPTNNILNSAITTSATFSAAAESPRANLWTVGSSGTSKVFSGLISLNDLAGVTVAEYITDDRFESTIGSSPSEVITATLGFYNPNAVSILVYYTVQLDFMVDFHDPIGQPQS